MAGLEYLKHCSFEQF